MTAQPESDLGSYEVIHLGGEAAAIVRFLTCGDSRQCSATRWRGRWRRLRWRRRWQRIGTGRLPDGLRRCPHEVAMAELLGDQ